MEEQNNIIIYKTKDDKSSIALYAKDGMPIHQNPIWD